MFAILNAFLHLYRKCLCDFKNQTVLVPHSTKELAALETQHELLLVVPFPNLVSKTPETSKIIILLSMAADMKYVFSHKHCASKLSYKYSLGEAL